MPQYNLVNASEPHKVILKTYNRLIIKAVHTSEFSLHIDKDSFIDKLQKEVDTLIESSSLKVLESMTDKGATIMLSVPSDDCIKSLHDLFDSEFSSCDNVRIVAEWCLVLDRVDGVTFDTKELEDVTKVSKDKIAANVLPEIIDKMQLSIDNAIWHATYKDEITLQFPTFTVTQQSSETTNGLDLRITSSTIYQSRELHLLFDEWFLNQQYPCTISFTHSEEKGIRYPENSFISLN